ncbi:MAG: hypothetical protein WBE89_09325 [Methyloceanibacter sp.]
MTRSRHLHEFAEVEGVGVAERPQSFIFGLGFKATTSVQTFLKVSLPDSLSEAHAKPLQERGMRFVISTIALLVLGSIFGSIASLLFWPSLPAATTSVGSVAGHPER